MSVDNGDERVFGTTKGWRSIPLHIEAGDWIREIRVYMTECDMLDERPDRSAYESMGDARPAQEVCIKSMSVSQPLQTS